MKDIKSNFVTIVISWFINLIKSLTTVKPEVLSNINIEGFINTLFMTGCLDRDALMANGYMLSDYKLDNRFKALVMPRGVYIDSDRLSLNVLDCSCLSIGLTLTPSEFLLTQSAILNCFRQQVGATTTLLDASMSLSLSDAVSRSVNSDQCHYDSVPFMPLNITVSTKRDCYYNYTTDEMIRDIVNDVLSHIRA